MVRNMKFIRRAVDNVGNFKAREKVAARVAGTTGTHRRAQLKNILVLLQRMEGLKKVMSEYLGPIRPNAVP